MDKQSSKVGLVVAGVILLLLMLLPSCTSTQSSTESTKTAGSTPNTTNRTAGSERSAEAVTRAFADATIPMIDSEIVLQHLNSYDTGILDDSAIEIVQYSPTNNRVYAINGAIKSFDILSVSPKSLDLVERIMIEDKIQDNSFTFGDVTSVAVDKEGQFLVLAIQHADYTAPGKAHFLNLEGKYIAEVTLGVQPDIITIAYEAKKVLVACEGEPREGYNNAIDPKGTVAIIDITNLDNFGNFGNAEALLLGFSEEMLDQKVIIQAGTKVSEDLEPEYIAVSEQTNSAYVAMQENNAIAKINLNTNTVEWVKGLGFKDFSISPIDPSKKDGINIRPVPVLGIYMPDGITVATMGGKDYLFTANEGDGREWGDYTNETTVGDLENIRLNAENYAGYTQEQLD